MNEELIEKLDDQAYELAMSSISYGGENFSDIQRNKFAELIIRECHLSITKYINECGEVDSFPIEILLKHFGLNDD